jgi:hypothetical protein
LYVISAYINVVVEHIVGLLTLIAPCIKVHYAPVIFAAGLYTTALYAFPTITLPAKAVAAATAKGFAADEYYCLQMLELAGVILVPGSGFGQEPGIALTLIMSLHTFYTHALTESNKLVVRNRFNKSLANWRSA